MVLPWMESSRVASGADEEDSLLACRTSARHAPQRKRGDLGETRVVRQDREDYPAAVEQALAAAGRAAGEPLSLPLAAQDISLVLKYYLLARVQRELPGLRPGVVEALTGAGFSQVDAFARRIWDRDLSGVLDVISKRFCQSLSSGIRERVLSEDFCRRVTFLVWEQLLGERSAPELRICPGAVGDVERRELLRDRPVVLVVFEAFPNVMNELFPLVVDGLVYNLDNFGSQCWRLAVAHVSWLGARCRPRRLILYDASRNRLIETDCDPPPVAAAVLVLCASPSVHRKVSLLASDNGVPELNPYSHASEWADSKIVSYDLWCRHAVPSPRSALIVQGSTREEVISRLEQFCLASVDSGGGMCRCSFQPNSGTEGHGVDSCILQVVQGFRCLEAVERIEALLAKDDVLIREVVGNVRFHAPESIHGRSCDLRVNVSFDGDRYRAESGYLQVAGDEESLVSSTSRGGIICKFSRGALAGLCGPDGGRVSLDPQTIEYLLAMAVSAAGVFPRVGLVGVDLKLEVSRAGHVGAQVLDANPRPAGLTHSQFFPLGGNEPEPGVTRHLWRRISTS